MPCGVLSKWFPRPRGYGFIKPPGGTDIFALARDFVGDMDGAAKVGSEVEYEVGICNDGRPRATKIKIVGQA